MPTVNWQCSKCGKQTTINSSNASATPPQSKCPDGGYHVWGRLGRFFNQVFDLF